MTTEALPDTSAQEGKPARRWLCMAGLLSAGVALAVAELLAGLILSVPSPVYAIGGVIIDAAPGWLERAAISVLGTADKPVLVLGIVLVAAAAGAALGVVAARRFAGALAGFALFGFAGFAASFSEPDAAPVPTALTLLVAVAAGVMLLHAMLRRAPVASASTAPISARRRTFLRLAGGAAVVTVAFALTGRWLSDRATVLAARSKITLPRPRRRTVIPADAEVDVPGITPYIVPNESFYRIDTALRPPLVDPQQWRLQITGAVDRPFELTYRELLELADTEKAITIACVSNEVGDDLVGNAVWQGLSLRRLLERAGVRPEGTQVVGRSVDGFTAGFPTSFGLEGDGLVAVGMNGVALPVEHGFPARLVIPGLYGYVSATKWLSAIELTSFEDFDGYWIPRGWAKEGPVKTQARIDVPRRGAPLTGGRQPIAGVAWAPTRGISAVEVRIDDEPWQEARLGGAVDGNTWRQWVLEWDASPGEHRIVVRAVDGRGETQTAESAPPFPSGATGYHTITVTVS